MVDEVGGGGENVASHFDDPFSDPRDDKAPASVPIPESFLVDIDPIEPPGLEQASRPVESTPTAGEAERSSPSKWLRDEWQQGPGCWIRVHNKPRKARFIPTGTKDGPDIRLLTSARSTKMTTLMVRTLN